MLELHQSDDQWRLNHGGDTFNTALYLARLGADVAYLSALGEDPFSETMRTAWIAEGIDTSLVLSAPGRLPGLYALQVDGAGERSFHYWRQQAAVRDLFRLPDCDRAMARAATADMLYLSGVTLALFNRTDRAQLIAVAKAVRARGGEVVFDPNYRLPAWSSKDMARDAIEAIAPAVSIVLPTFDDEAMLFNDRNPGETVVRWRAFGAREIVVKLGPDRCVLGDGRTIAPASPLAAVDTTGAGDAFNAAYLAARQHACSDVDAAAFANTLAGRVIMSRGAIVSRDAMLDLMESVKVWRENCAE